MISFRVFTPPDPLPDAASHDNIFSLDMGSRKAATSDPIPWNMVQSLGLGQGYDPVMALAQNHIHFLNSEDGGPGNANIFVIHCEVAF